MLNSDSNVSLLITKIAMYHRFIGEQKQYLSVQQLWK